MIKINTNQGLLEQDLDWAPLTDKSANFTTHKMHLYGPYKMQSSQTLFYSLFLLLFLVVGIILLCFTTYGEPVYRNGAAPFRGDSIGGDLLAYFLGVVFTLVGFSLFLEKAVVIDKLNNRLATGEKNACHDNFDWSLDKIVAVQLLSKRCGGGDDDYVSFELNAVFQNRTRVNLLAHGGQTSIVNDAKRVAKFLGKPLLKKIEHPEDSPAVLIYSHF